MKLLFPLMLVILLAGCTTATDQPIKSAVSANTPEEITYTSTFSPPTVTVTPTSIPTLTYTLEPTGTPIPTATITPVWADLLKEYSAFNPGGNPSPDNHWVWGISDVAIPDPGSTTPLHTTRFVSADGTTFWDVRPTKEQLAGHEFSDVSYTPIFWLPNEPYVYLSAHACCMDGPGPGFFTGMNLARLNLRTGEFSLQIAQWAFHEFIFSSNGKYLFEATAWKPEVHLIRLSNWNQITVNMPPHNRRNGGGAWAPDNNKIVFFSIKDDPLDEWMSGHSSVILIDLSDTSKIPEYRTLVSDIEGATGNEDLVGCVNMEWVDLNRIRLSMESGCNTKGQWIIDVDSGKVEKVK